jgi:DNA mismatch repair protein MLH1
MPTPVGLSGAIHGPSISAAEAFSQASESPKRKFAKVPDEEPLLPPRPARKVSKMAVFDELKYEPVPSKMTRGDHRQRTIEQVIAASAVQAAPRAISRAVDVHSVSKLRHQIEKCAYPALCGIFRRIQYIGLVELSKMYFSSDEAMYQCDLFPVTRLLFYQLCVAQFGNFGRIALTDATEINALASLIAHPEMDVAAVLEEHGELLENYFAIVVRNGFVVALPNVLPGYTPSFIALSLFLVRLATEVEWEFEFDCIEQILNELSMLYAVIPEDARDEHVKGRLAAEIENIVVPALKSDAFLPTAQLSAEGAVIQIANVPHMYRVFERS